MATPLLQCHGVVKRLPSGTSMLTILDGIDLVVPQGDFVTILGPSGSGKSTLLGLLAGLDRPTEGSIQFEGQALESMNEDALARWRRGRVGFVFQDFQLLANLTAMENILFPLELTGVADARERAREMLARVGLAQRGHHHPSQLSGGEQQRVALARAFAPGPALLLADEPTGNLDAETGGAAMDLLVDLRDRTGATLILVTHDDKVAARAHRRVHLETGRIVREEANA